MRAFSGILGGAPVPPPMAHVPLRPGTGHGGAGNSSVGTRGAGLCWDRDPDCSYVPGAFCSRHRPSGTARADLVSGVHRPGTPGIIRYCLG